jgi:hypothetical protein
LFEAKKKAGEDCPPDLHDIQALINANWKGEIVLKGSDVSQYIHDIKKKQELLNERIFSNSRG